MKVCKFGGTSMANSATITQVADIVSSDASRAYIVVSAPGKRDGGDVKVTDALYACAREKNEKGNCDEAFAVIEKRFLDIEKELGINVGMAKELKAIKAKIEDSIDNYHDRVEAFGPQLEPGRSYHVAFTYDKYLGGALYIDGEKVADNFGDFNVVDIMNNNAPLRTAVLPVIALSLYPISMIARLTRSSMLEVMKQDYIILARSKGTSYKMVVIKHALKNAMLPVVTYAGPAFAFMLTGSFVVETIFSIPGTGKEFVSNISNRDYQMIMGLTLFLGALIITFNISTDIVAAMIDPRIKLK